MTEKLRANLKVTRSRGLFFLRRRLRDFAELEVLHLTKQIPRLGHCHPEFRQLLAHAFVRAPQSTVEGARLSRQPGALDPGGLRHRRLMSK